MRSISSSLSHPQTIGFSLHRALVDRSSWFEKDDLNECEKTWILLLKNISQDLQCTSWQAVSSFPEFFGKVEVVCCILVVLASCSA